MLYRSTIVGELGNVMFWCSELSETEKTIYWLHITADQ